MKLIKDKLFLPKLLRDILNVVYWFTIIGMAMQLISVSWLFAIDEGNTARMLLTIHQGSPVGLRISEIGKIVIDNSSYEVLVSIAEAMVLVKNPPFNILLFNILLYLISTGGFLYIINLLRKVLKNISDGKQFNNQNSIYIRNIGLIVIVSSIIETILKYSISVYFSANITFENISITSYIGSQSVLGVFFLGFVILVISKIFKLGTEIKSEQDLTI